MRHYLSSVWPGKIPGAGAGVLSLKVCVHHKIPSYSGQTRNTNRLKLDREFVSIFGIEGSQSIFPFFLKGVYSQKTDQRSAAPPPGSCPVTSDWVLSSRICISCIKEDHDWLGLSHLIVTGVLLPGGLCISHSCQHLDWQAYWERSAVPGGELVRNQIACI